MQSKLMPPDRALQDAGSVHDAELFKKATERFPGMLAIVGADGRGLYFNPSLLAYFGTQPERLDGNRWFLYIHEEDRVPFTRKWRRALRRQKTFRAEARILHPQERSYRRFLIHAVPLGPTRSASDTWVVTCTDVQDLRETEAALEDASAHLRSIFETSQSSLILCAPDGSVAAANPAAKKRIQALYGRELRLGAELWDVLPESRGASLSEGFAQALAGNHWESEDVVHTSDGRAHWLHVTYAPVLRGDDVTGVSLSAVDVTDRKQAEEARLEHERSIRANRERVEQSLRNMAVELEERVASQTKELRREIADRRAVEADLDLLRQRLVEQGEYDRAALATGLHDNVLQELLGLHLNVSNVLSNAEAQIDATELRAELDGVLVGMRKIIGSLRRTIRGLKPTALDELGLRSALESFVGGIDVPTKPEIVLDFDEVGTLPRGLQLCLFRVGQESIQNAVKHAGARRLVASLRWEGRELILHVSDDGAGFEVPRRISSLVRDDHFGLAGVAEHVVACGGTFEMRSEPGNGTVVEARFPREAT